MNLINYGLYRNRRNSGLALYLKILVLVTTISVPNFMLVPEISSYAAGLLGHTSNLRRVETISWIRSVINFFLNEAKYILIY